MPNGLSYSLMALGSLEFYFLLAAGVGTSALSGAMGMGGGITLMGVMAPYFPLIDLIPLHGIIQLSSNLIRTVMSYQHFKKPILYRYAMGTLLGVAAGSLLAIRLPDSTFKILLGGFILFVTFAPRPKNLKPFPGKWFFLGGFATFLGMIFGATGPLIAPFYLRENLTKEELVSTKAACQSVSHLMKVFGFFFLGFSVTQYLPFLGAMVGAAILGNIVGKALLGRISEKVFQRIFRVLILFLSARMIYLGLAGGGK